jgi:hypothetical protein
VFEGATMKCIYCNSDSNYKTRKDNGGRCGACQHPFAFEPRGATPSITDPRFKRIIQDVSGDGKIAFTDRQLWYEFNRKLWRKRFWKAPWGRVAAISAGAGVASSWALDAGWLLLSGIAGTVFAAIMSRRGPQPPPGEPPVSYNTFLSYYLGRWEQAHGKVEKLLPPVTPRLAPATREAEPDLTAYSFDRALVTDHDHIAAMLVANNFHFENNCAILSADGYPSGIADTVMTMLRRNPQLKVFALHDASARGCALPRTLRGERWFPDTSIGIIDLGLRPKHVQQMKLFTLAGSPRVLASDVGALMSTEEAAWLEAGQTAELDALRPARLMRAIYQGFARAGQIGHGDAATGDGGVIWFYDGGADVYAADSFG